MSDYPLLSNNTDDATVEVLIAFAVSGNMCLSRDTQIPIINSLLLCIRNVHTRHLRIDSPYYSPGYYGGICKQYRFMDPESTTADILKRVISAETGMLSRPIPVIDDRIQPKQIKMLTKLLLDHSRLPELESQKANLQRALKEIDEELFIVRAENETLERENEGLWKELEAAIKEKVTTWCKSQTAAQPELHLIANFRAYLSKELKLLNVTNLEESTEFVFAEHIAALLSKNLSLIEPEIEKVCSDTMSTYTTRSVKSEISKQFPSPVFSRVNHFTKVLSCELNSVIDKYFPAGSESQNAVNVQKIILQYEEKLIDEYRKSKFDVFDFIEQDFAANVRIDSERSDTVQSCLLFELDEFLHLHFKDQWRRCKASLGNISDAPLPISVKRMYKSRMKDAFVECGMKCIANYHLPVYMEVVGNQLGNLILNSEECEMFDEKMVDAHTREVIFCKLWKAIGIDSEEKSEFFDELAKFMRIPANFDQDIDRDFPMLQQTLAVNTLGFILICVLLILTRAVFVYVPRHINPLLSVRYTPKHRQLYRKVATVLYQQRFEMKINMIMIDEWMLGKPCETVLAHFLKERNHPFISSIPSLLFEEADKYGAAKAAEMTDTPGGDEPGNASWYIRVKKSFKEIVGQGFNWVSIKDVPSLSTTIVISGWQSDFADPEYIRSSWSYLNNFPLESTTISLNWDSDTPFTSVVKSLVWIPISLYFNKVEKTEFSWTTFQNACQKAENAGKLLADNIERRAFGLGPVSLIGFSLGTRVIFSCLDRLRQISSEQLVENVVLLGGAMHNSADMWSTAIATTVAGSVTNVYSQNDWTLRYLYKAAMHEPPIGLGPILCDRVTNCDAESVVSAHMDHRGKMNQIFELIKYQP